MSYPGFKRQRSERAFVTCATRTFYVKTVFSYVKEIYERSVKTLIETLRKILVRYITKTCVLDNCNKI
jgi:hypothetical protein